MTYTVLEQCDHQLFELTRRRAIALTFSPAKPEGLSHLPNSQPSACSFWKFASEGHVFYADASEHFGCLIGAYVLGAEFLASQYTELAELTSEMVKLSYLKPREAAEIPRCIGPLRYVIYAPLGLSPAPPHLVLVRGNMRHLMLLTEAACSAGFPTGAPAMGRPACAMVPESLASGQVILSLGCVGNRIYTGLEDQEGYLAIPGNTLELICHELNTIRNANEQLTQFHASRQAQFHDRMAYAEDHEEASAVHTFL